MSADLKSRAWRWGAVALFCGLPVLLLVLSIANLTDAADANDLASRQNATLSTIVAKLAKRPSRDLTPEEKTSLYLASSSATLARAEIQDRATKLVAQAGGRLVEAQLPGTPEQESDGTVAIQLTLDIDNKGLFDLLYATESGLPLLDVSDLTIATTRDDNPSGAGTGASAPLRVQMTVQGHFRKGLG